MKSDTMMLFYCGLAFIFLVHVRLGEGHVHITGPFGKIHREVNIPSPFNCNRTLGLSPNSSSLGITDLQVSSTHYSNKEHINVSWTPLSSPCNDDFIGIYFVEVPVETGK